MMDFWSLVAFAALATLSGALVSALSVAVWGLGAVSALRRRMESLEGSHLETQNKVNVEIKRRAGLEGAAARAEKRSVEEEARNRLESGSRVASLRGRLPR